MPPKTKKQQATQEDADKDAIRVGPLVQWLVRDAATTPIVPCPSGRCYANAALYDGRLYVFGGWNGLSRTEALKAKKIPNLQQLNKNLLNVVPAVPPIASASSPMAAPNSPVHVPAPPSSAPAGGKKKPSAASNAAANNTSATNMSATMSATSGPGAVTVNSLFANADGTSNARLGTAAGGGGGHLPIQSVPHPCHERDILCYDIGTSAWSVVDNVLGEPHPGSSQCGLAELGGAVVIFGGWDGYRRNSALTLFSQTDDRWKPYNTNADNMPPPLCFHAVCGYGRKLFVFGGEMADGINPDMYVLDLTALNWSVAPSAGIPTRRTSHTMTVLQGLYVIIFGGRNADGVALSDVSIYDINSNHWVVGLKTVGVGPARFGHSAVAVTDKSILIYGGMGPKMPGTGGPNATGGGGGGGSGGSGGGGSSGKEKAGDKEREAQQAAVIMNTVGSYELHADVWLLTLGDKLGSVSWERCQVGTSTEPVLPRGVSPARSAVGSMAADGGSLAGTPVPTTTTGGAIAGNSNVAAAGAAALTADLNAPPGATPIASMAGSRATTPMPGFAAASAPPPGPRCGHSAVLFGNVVYIYGGRTDSVGSVSRELGVLDVTAILPPPPPPTEGRDTRMDTESTMRAPSSAMTQ